MKPIVPLYQYNFCISYQYIGCESTHPDWIGDGYCDDETNNAGCMFDGGDCCGTNPNTLFCNQCICYE